VRYIAPLSWGWPKALTALEILDLGLHGIQVALAFEVGIADYTGGYGKGQAQAGDIAQALADLKIAPGTPVYIAIDTEVAPANFTVSLV